MTPHTTRYRELIDSTLAKQPTAAWAAGTPKPKEFRNVTQPKAETTKRDTESRPDDGNWEGTTEERQIQEGCERMQASR